MKIGTVLFEVRGDLVYIHRERKPTKAERLKNPTAVVMAETVGVKFSEISPRVVINRELCTR